MWFVHMYEPYAMQYDSLTCGSCHIHMYEPYPMCMWYEPHVKESRWSMYDSHSMWTSHEPHMYEPYPIWMCANFTWMRHDVQLHMNVSRTTYVCVNYTWMCLDQRHMKVSQIMSVNYIGMCNDLRATYECVTNYKWLCQLHMNVSRSTTYKCVTNDECVSINDIWTCHELCMCQLHRNMPRSTNSYECANYTWMRHDSHIKESHGSMYKHIPHEWVTSPIWMSHEQLMNESRNNI